MMLIPAINMFLGVLARKLLLVGTVGKRVGAVEVSDDEEMVDGDIGDVIDVGGSTVVFRGDGTVKVVSLDVEDGKGNLGR
jgi:hypothetical protein